MMERLTTVLEDKVYYAKGKWPPTTLCAEMEVWEIRDCMTRLAQYEDAEEEGRLVELPCKVGDTVYFNSHYSKGTLRGEVKAITIDKHGTILTLLTKTKQITRKSIEQVYVNEEEVEKAKGEAT